MKSRGSQAVRRRMREGGTSAVVVAALGLGICACGSSNSGLSRTALAAKANAICSPHRAAISSAVYPILNSGGGKPGDPRFAKAITTVVAPHLQQELKELQRLKPASSVKDQWERWLRNFGAQVKAISAQPGPPPAGTNTSPGKLPDSGPPAFNGHFWVLPNEEAQALGVGACAGPL